MEKTIFKDGYDVVIVGGGPCGCVLAKDLSKAGKKVLLIEQGGNSLKGIGTSKGMLNGEHMTSDKGKTWSMSIEGNGIVLGKGIGGGSYLYAGIAAFPDFSAWTDQGMDLKPYLDSAKIESWVNETPDEFIGPINKRMMESANELGYPFVKSHRHINFNKCKYACTKAPMGCPLGAKWMGYYAAQEAVEYGAELQLYTKVDKAIVEKGKAVGFYAKGEKDDQLYEIRGKMLICSAGGVGTASILQHSGITHAGMRMFGDPSFSSWALLPVDCKDSGTNYEHGTSVGFVDDEHGGLFQSDVAWGRSFWAMYQIMNRGIKPAIQAYKLHKRKVGIFNKIHDEGVGRITWDRKVSKTLTPLDEQHMNYCRYVNEKILYNMGCEPGSVHHAGMSHHQGGVTFGHPGGSCPVGLVLDNTLESPIPNLFACDISVIPGAPSRPPTLTLVTLSKWFVPRVLARLNNTSVEIENKHVLGDTTK